MVAKHAGLLASMVVVAIVVFAAVAAPYVSPHAPNAQDLEKRLRPPLWFGGDADHILGTDSLGRDLLSRLIYGSRVSVIVGISSVIIAMVVGTFLGVLSGWYGKAFGAVIARIADIVFAFPFLLLALLLVTLMGGGLVNIVIALGATGWVVYARLVRGEVLSLKEREYVQAGLAIGAGTGRIMVVHLLPNLMTSLVIVGTLEVGTAILSEASLSFLGLGIPPSVPSWGQMVESGRNYIYTAWWIASIPGLAIALLVLAINFLGDWLRDRLDPLA